MRSEDQSTKEQHQTSPFFSLPAELRNRIYHLVNNHPYYIYPSDSDDDTNSRKTLASARSTRPAVTIDRLFTQPGYKLTQTSTQLRLESSPVFFSINTFKFYLCFPPPAWVFRVEERFLSFIGRIVLEDYQGEAWHPTPVCQSRIEVDLVRCREGEGSVVTKRTDGNCRECERRRGVRCGKLEGIVRGLVEVGEGGKQSAKLTREGLLGMFEAARWHFGEESRLAGIEERVID